jgi:hypothetical protein
MPRTLLFADFLDEVCNVHWHLFDLGRVELLDIPHHPDILSSNKVDCNTIVNKVIK